MQSGISKAGNNWKKREWVLETFGNYPRKVKFHVFGDRSDTIGIEVGNTYRLSFDLESREFNGRWYTDVSVFAATPSDGTGAAPAPAYPQQPQYGATPAPGSYAAPAAPAAPVDPFAPGAAPNDDLPF